MKISIITVNYNNISGLKRTLESIDGQTFKEYEFVIVDGGSKDGSREVIEQYAEEHPATVWVSESDKGIYNAMNKGVEMATGDYCIFMNSEDCFYFKDSLQQCSVYLDGQYDIVSGAVMTDRFSKRAPREDELSLAFFIKDNMNHQSTFICRSLLKDYPYNEERRIVGDHEFFFQTLLLNNVTYLDIPLCISYCEEAGESGDLEQSINERLIAIKALLPPRMIDDVDFIQKFHNPITMWVGRLFYKKSLRKLFYKYNQIRKRFTR